MYRLAKGLGDAAAPEAENNSTAKARVSLTAEVYIAGLGENVRLGVGGLRDSERKGLPLYMQKSSATARLGSRVSRYCRQGRLLRDLCRPCPAFFCNRFIDVVRAAQNKS